MYNTNLEKCLIFSINTFYDTPHCQSDATVIKKHISMLFIENYIKYPKYDEECFLLKLAQIYLFMFFITCFHLTYHKRII